MLGSIEIVTMVTRGLLSFSLVVVGFFALKKGFDIVSKGIGKKKEETTIHFWKFKATTGSIGSLVMVTASLWGLFAFISFPSLKVAGDEVEIRARFAALSEEHERTKNALDSYATSLAGVIAELPEGHATAFQAAYSDIPPHARDSLVNAMAHSWVERDPSEATDWISSLKSEEQHGVYLNVAELWAKQDPEQALMWAYKLDSDDFREEAMAKVVAHWRAEDIDAAHAAIDSMGGLSEEERDQLKEQLR